MALRLHTRGAPVALPLPLPWLLPLLALAGAGAGALWAEVAGAEAEPVELLPFTVTAQHFELPAATVPAQIQALDAGQLAAIGAADVTTALAQLANLQVRSVSANASTAELSLRGFGANSQQRVLVLVDGVPVNRFDIAAINWSRLPLQLIESIEVLRGAHSVLYGNHAVGGVVKITTRKRRSQGLAGQAGLALGSYSLRNAYLAVEGAAGPVHGLALVDAQRTHGYRANNMNESEHLYGLVGGAWRSLDWSVRASVTETAYALPGPLTETRFDTQPRSSSLPANTNEGTYTHASLKLDHTGDRHAVTLIAGADHRALRWDLQGNNVDNDQTSLVLHPHHRWEGAWLRLTTGLDLRYARLDAQRYDTPARGADTRLGDAQLERPALAAYTHLGLSLLDDTLQLYGGARYERARLSFENTSRATTLIEGFEQTSGSQDATGLAAQLGLTWRAHKALRLWSRLDRLYRYPAFDEVAAYQGFTLSTPFNADLEPERGWNAEVGFDGVWQNLSLSLALFQQWLEGEIAFADRANRNLADSLRRGLDLRLGWEPAPWFALQVLYSYVYATWASDYRALPLDGNEHFLVPRHQLALQAQLRHRWGAWQVLLSLGYRYTGSAREGDDFGNTRPKIDPYGVADLYLSLDWREHYTLFVAIDNVADAHYASVVYLDTYYPEPGRRARAGLAWAF